MYVLLVSFLLGINMIHNFFIGGSICLTTIISLTFGTGWVMIMLVDMNVRWEVGMGMLMKGLMAGTWVVHLVAFRVVLPVVTAQLFFLIIHFLYKLCSFKNMIEVGCYFVYSLCIAPLLCCFN